MSAFHNPYAAVPLAGGDLPGTVALSRRGASRKLPNEARHLDHARFLPGNEDFFSGRIVCRLTVLELLATGSWQTSGCKESNTPRVVELFDLDGEPALAGSGLRGLFSAIAEAASGGALRVLKDQKLSLSAGPKNRKKLGSVFDYLQNAQHAGLLPLRQGDGRQILSLVEGLFGVVEVLPEGKTAPSDWEALALGSRLRVSHGRLHGTCKRAGEQITQILDSPKPPAPAFYFKHRRTPGAFIPKLSLSPTHHEPQGRKFYLHRRKLENCDWITNGTDQQHQKARVNPLASGTFWFHLDFFNLTRIELELICYAIRPSAEFRHKLGMGKPLGLGKVAVEPMGLFLVDRHLRYSSDTLDEARYSHIFRSPKSSEWPDRYASERDCPATSQAAPCPRTLSADWRTRVERDFPDLLPALQALEQIGDPQCIRAPVHYPQIEGPQPGIPSFEKAHFKWFVQNEKTGRQALGSLPDPSGTLPTLDRGGTAGPSSKKPAAAPPAKPTKSKPSVSPGNGDSASGTRQVGDIVNASVTGHACSKKGNWYAALLDIGGDKGSLLAKEMDVGWVSDARSVLPEGTSIRVRILALQAPNGSPVLQCSLIGVKPS